MKARFKIGDRVFDRDGFAGTIADVDRYNGAVAYDVRFAGGVAVRYDSDLCPAVVTVPDLGDRCNSWTVIDHRTQKPIVELWNRGTVEELARVANPGRVDILPTADWLARVNGRG